jgi:organic hydroperoxide reductase OsmC/OhrA
MSFDVTFRTVPGTQAAATQGPHRVVVDRPKGVAGGKGLGLNGGQLLAMAIGGCLSNDVRYVARDLGVMIDDIEIDVSLEVEDGIVLSAAVDVLLDAPDGVDTAEVIRRAVDDSTVLAAVRAGFPIDVRRG